MEEEIDISLVSHIEMRLRRSLLDPDIKSYYASRLEHSQDRNELITILKVVEDNQPIMGLEIIPQGQGEELKQAIQFRTDRDDYYDRYKD